MAQRPLMYKDVMVGKGSALATALSITDPVARSKEAKKVFNETTSRYEQQYSKEDRAWFQMMSTPISNAQIEELYVNKE